MPVAATSSSSAPVGRSQRAEQGEWRAGTAARRVDAHVGGRAQTGDAVRRLVPFRESRLPTWPPARLQPWRRRWRPAVTHGAKSAAAQSRETSAADSRGRPWDRSRAPARRRSRPLRSGLMPSPVLPLPVIPTQTAWVSEILRVVEHRLRQTRFSQRGRSVCRGRRGRAARNASCADYDSRSDSSTTDSHRIARPESHSTASLSWHTSWTARVIPSERRAE